MRDWSLHPTDPLYLTLAADARLSSPDYVNDHIWELELGSGEPAALSVRTTFGLRARSMRIFPRFTESGKAVANPLEFASPPVIKRFYPNFIALEFSPLEGLEVKYDICVPQSTAIGGRISIANRTPDQRKVLLEVCAALVPLEGRAMTHTQLQMVNIMHGETSNLVPVVFLTGGPSPGPGPHSSLMLDLDLHPAETRQLTWTQAASGNYQSSFDIARLLAAQPWDAEQARIELVNARDMVEIYTSDLEWDTALALSQVAAHGLFYPGSEKLPHPSFVQTRQPDHGYSRKGDGSDYPASWSGQTPLDAYYLSEALPTVPGLAQNVLQNFLATQNDDGSVDSKPGLGGQRGRHLAMPILASLAWKIYESNEDKKFLTEAFPKLLAFFWAWFSPANDRNRDGVPEWAHPLQTGYEDNPFFDTWHPWSQGVDIHCINHPALGAMLYREARHLVKIAERIGRKDALLLLQRQAEKIKTAVDESWNPRSALYTYRDRETKLSTPGKVLAKQKGPGIIKLKKEFPQPVRLLIEVQTGSPAAKRPQVLISEYVTKGESESIPGSQFHWRSGGMVATSQTAHTKIGKVHIKDIDKQAKVIVRSVDYTSEDHTLLLPLWAEIPDTQQAQTMIRRTILNADRFGRPFGLPACPFNADPEAAPVCLSVHLPWNALICEGLLAYGHREEAARLLVHLMTGIIQNLKQKSAFYQHYHSETGQGIGERNTLGGMAPVGLFLRILGVQILSPAKVRLDGKNPFPWAVTIKFKGLTIHRSHEETQIVFPNGKQTAITTVQPTIISMA